MLTNLTVEPIKLVKPSLKRDLLPRSRRKCPPKEKTETTSSQAWYRTSSSGLTSGMSRCAASLASWCAYIQLTFWSKAIKGRVNFGLVVWFLYGLALYFLRNRNYLGLRRNERTCLVRLGTVGKGRLGSGCGRRGGGAGHPANYYEFRMNFHGGGRCAPVCTFVGALLSAPLTCRGLPRRGGCSVKLKTKIKKSIFEN